MMREVFNSHVMIANLVPFVNCLPSFCMVMLSSHEYKLTVKQTVKSPSILEKIISNLVGMLNASVVVC